MTWNSHDEDEKRRGVFTNWEEFRRALIVYVVCSAVWSGLILAGTRLWHK